MMNKMIFPMLSFIIVLLLGNVNICSTHPQCLDFRPPYKPAKELSFCRKYSEYGCCNADKDAGLEHNFKYVKETARDKNITDSECLDFVKDLMCLECHPYAAHVFDAERATLYVKGVFTKRGVTFPGLCRNFCISNFERCKNAVLSLATTKAFYEFASNANATDFCSWAGIPDSNYCYPDVNNVNISTKRLEVQHKDRLCVQPVHQATFANALVAVHAGDGTHRLFIGEQRGFVYVLLKNGTKLKTPFLNLTNKIVNSGSPWDERGLLGLTFHPGYKKNGRFYVYYSAPGKGLDRGEHSDYKWYWQIKHRIRVSEFTVEPNNPHVADHASELPLIEVDQPEPNHNGGMILFGQDGYLYVSIGDGGGSGDRHGTHGNGLLMKTLLGKILRIDIDSEHKLYEIPRDNPFRNYRNVKPEIYAFGVRNTWRCSVDRGGSRRLFCGDVGQNKYEEINIIEKGKNYGWRAYEGNSCFDEKLCHQKLTNLKFPIITYGHDIGRSIVGGYVYRGCDNPGMYGKYFFADTMTGRIFSAEENIKNKAWDYREIQIGNSSFCNNGLSDYHHKNILSFGESESGELYILSTLNPHPKYESSVLYRLVDPVRRGNPELCKFKPSEAKPLKIIKRRKIYEKFKRQEKLVTAKKNDRNNKKGKKKRIKSCVDRRSNCHVYYISQKKRKPLLDCKKTKHFSSRWCKQTCGFCPVTTAASQK